MHGQLYITLAFHYSSEGNEECTATRREGKPGGGNDVEEKANTLSDAGGGGEESDEGSRWF